MAEPQRLYQLVLFNGIATTIDDQFSTYDLIVKDFLMNTYISRKLVSYLTLDNRSKKIDVPHVTLRIVDKHDPDSWSLQYQQSQFDYFLAIIERGGCESGAHISLAIESDEPLTFAPQHKCSPRQVFSGVLFVASNQTIQKLDAFDTELNKNGSLMMAIKPSKFWQSPRVQKCAPTDDTHIGFRFVVEDQHGQQFYSNDPVIIVRDWVRT